MTTTIKTDVKEILYKYSANGWHVFPVCWFDDKNKCVCGYRDPEGKPHEGNNVGKAPFLPHGLKEATQTQAGVDEFIRRYPKANWAGWFPGMLVLH